MLFGLFFSDDSFLSQVSGSRKKEVIFFLDWMKPEEPAEFLELIHFSLCLRVPFKELGAAVTPEGCREMQWDLVAGLWAPWFMARELPNFVVTWVPATCTHTFREIYQGFQGAVQTACVGTTQAVHPCSPPWLSCTGCPYQLCSTTGTIPGGHTCWVLNSWYNLLSCPLSLDAL